MASWGDVAVGGVRPSHNYPTKSAILGLIAAALGIKRTSEDELQKLQDSLNFYVRVDEIGTPIIDYHTAQVPSASLLKKVPHFTRKDEINNAPLNTILSAREYYCDSIHTIILEQNKANSFFSLTEIKNALIKPSFFLYLGRKSAPLGMPIYPILVDSDSTQSALIEADAKLADFNKTMSHIRTSKTEKRLYSEGSTLASPIHSYQDKRKRKDALLNRQRWQFNDREEVYIAIASSGDE